VADVRRTVQLLREARFPGNDPSWSDLIEGARAGEDAFHVRLTLKQGFLDPLYLMSFKVLPEALQRPDDPEFAKAPIGSGPYQFAGRDGEYALFKANQHYEARPNAGGLPHIREIRLFHSKNPLDDFQADRLQLLLDLPPRTSKLLADARLRDVSLQPLRNRRIYFLAVNHRRKPLQHVELRRAMAHAIDREAILNKVFRDGQPNQHRPLNGPYLPGTWACKPTIPADLYKFEQARALAEKAREDLTGSVKLTLKFPDDDPAVAEACNLIREQVAKLGTGIDVELQPRSVRNLHNEVAVLHDYDLAYYSWDYATDAYWLWPALDPRGAGEGGANVCGYANDEVLESLFRKVMVHRDFAVVQDLTRQIHEAFYDKMPFIPLWQLDGYLAFRNGLTLPADLDLMNVFGDVEHWMIERH
jgi:peptide/nickel transport system substrate-binding protein